jgi:ATP citrate (pro-S)-lyase
MESIDFVELVNQQPWLSTTKLVIKLDMLFGKLGKSGLVALNLDIAQVKDTITGLVIAIFLSALGYFI